VQLREKARDWELRLHRKRSRSRNPRTACQSAIQLCCFRPVSAREGPTGGAVDEAAGAVAEAGVAAAGAGAVGASGAGGTPEPLESSGPVSSSRLVAPGS
jgi:hypothetical protein